ncbi:perlucin-like protein isoform X2 [Aplysia californica]|uniref:Perlucin-like protein isoform X2 n=1 Tax=Aplysia californica TaxID=6500 RepID=A0ABM1A1B5_APLCA|nr:perlucin-like protein isoform X2 [Aplysia californica]
MTCLATFEDCYSFLYHNATKTCTPGLALSFSAQPPSPSEGTLYLANVCDQSQEFVNVRLSAGTTICVYVSGTTGGYNIAKKICQEKGSHLYGVQTLAKYQLFRDIVTMYPGLYLLGLTDLAKEGTWRWDVDGTVVTKEIWDILWLKGEPSRGRNQDCAVAYKPDTKNRFNDVQCSMRTYINFICEKYPTLGSWDNKRSMVL